MVVAAGAVVVAAGAVVVAPVSVLVVSVSPEVVGSIWSRAQSLTSTTRVAL